MLSYQRFNTITKEITTMTKREAVAQLKAEDIKLLAEAADAGTSIKNFNTADMKRVKRAVKLLRKVRAAQ